MSKLKIVGIMPVYNEVDIVEQTITYMSQQGIPLIIIEGNSTDRSLEIERKFVGKGVLEIRIVQPNPYYDRKAVLSEGYRSALQYSPDWIVYVDADEFLESPLPAKTLAESIEEVDRLGYNLIQFNCFEFLLTEKDYQSSETDIRKRLRFYTWNADFYFRVWKHYPGTDLIKNAGHKPTFPSEVTERVFPAKFILRHYKFRSLEQGLRKVFTERLPRYDPKNRAIGWHIHYDNLKPDPSYFIADSLKLNRHDDGERWNLEKRYDTYFGAWNAPGADDHPPPSEQLKELGQKIVGLQQQFNAIYRAPPVRLYRALKKLFARS